MRLHPGEVEATGWRVMALGDLIQRLRGAAPGVTGRPVVIAVDGRGGAGKTVLAQRLREAVPASAVVHTDDVAWNQASFDWGHLMAEHVLRPLHQGAAVDFAPPAWGEHGREGVISVPAGLDVVWVEGAGIIRGELERWIDASIYVQADLDAQQARLVARDGDDTAVREHIAAWLAEELPFMAREQPWAEATVIVAGASDLPHDPRTEIVVAPPPVVRIAGLPRKAHR